MKRASFNIFAAPFLGVTLILFALTVPKTAFGGNYGEVAVSLYTRLSAMPSLNGKLAVSLPGERGAPDSILSVPMGTDAESGLVNTYLRPGIQYEMTVWGSYATSYALSFVQVHGYDIYIDGASTSTISDENGPSIFAQVYTIELRAKGEANLPVGAMSPIKMGLGLAFTISLGTLPGNASAGSIIISTSDMLWRLPEIQVNSKPATDSELDHRIVYGPFMDGFTVSQIMCPQALVTITHENGCQVISFYEPSSGFWDTSTYTYTISGLPWKRYELGSAPYNGQYNYYIKEREDEGEWITTVRYSGGTSADNLDWRSMELYEGAGATGRRTEYQSSKQANGLRIEQVYVRSLDTMQIASGIYRAYIEKPWGEVLIEEFGSMSKEDERSDGRSFIYHDDVTKRGNYGKIKAVIEATGKWVAFDYYDDWERRGLVKREYRPWVNHPESWSTDSLQGRVTEYVYESSASDKEPRLVRVSTTVDGQIIGDRQIFYDELFLNYPRSGSEGLRVVIAEERNYASPLQYVARKSAVCRSTDFASAYEMMTFLKQSGSVRHSIVPMQIGSYEKTTARFTSNTLGDHWREVTIEGLDPDAGIGTLWTSYDGVPIVPLHVVPEKTRIIERIYSNKGLVRTATYVLDQSLVAHCIQWENYEYNNRCRVERQTTSIGLTIVNTYDAGLLKTQKSAPGTTEEFFYDSLRRIRLHRKQAPTPSGTVETIYGYDPRGMMTEKLTGNEIRQEWLYDWNGRLVGTASSSTGATWLESVMMDKYETIYNPDGSTKTTTIALDGRIVSTTGTAVVSEDLTFGIELGEPWVKRTLGDGARWEIVWTDWLGRIVRVKRPRFSESATNAEGKEQIEVYSYNASTGALRCKAMFDELGNRLVADQYTEHDVFGEVILTGVDLDETPGLQTDGKDRVTEFMSRYCQLDNAWWHKTSSTQYTVDEAADTGLITNTVCTKLTALGDAIAEVRTIDSAGNIHTARTEHVAAEGLAVTTRTSSGVTSVHRSEERHGLLTFTRDFDGAITTLTYDNCGRVVSIESGKDGKKLNAYSFGSERPSSTSDDKGIITDRITYDACGRVTSYADSNGAVVNYAYNPRGQVESVWGTNVIPVCYEYDSYYGECIGIHTYRNLQPGQRASLPLEGDPDVSTIRMTFDKRTGLLVSKADELGMVTTFTYDKMGRILSKMLPASGTDQSRVIAYHYDSKTGALLNIYYSDYNTQPVTFTYDRIGRIATVFDSAGRREMTYGGCGQLVRETLHDLLDGRSLEHVVERSTAQAPDLWGYACASERGRRAGFRVHLRDDEVGELEQILKYDVSGRLVGMVAAVDGEGQRDYVYSYDDVSKLISSYTCGEYAESVKLGPTRICDEIKSTWLGENLLNAIYEHGPSRRVESVVRSGRLVVANTLPEVLRYTYDNRGFVQTESGYVFTGEGELSVVSSRGASYQYDNNGNCKSQTVHSVLTEWSIDKANSYIGFNRTQLVTPFQTVDVAGRKDPEELKLYDANAQMTSGIDLPAEVVVGGLSYDSRGNLISDEKWQFTWDSENRLNLIIPSQQQIADNPNAFAYEMWYDYLGRRTQVIKIDPVSYEVIEEKRYLYKNWELVAEYTCKPTGGVTLSRVFEWGVNLANQSDLLGDKDRRVLYAVIDCEQNKKFLALHDAAGNVCGLVDALSGQASAVYDYNARGQITYMSGDYAVRNPWRFDSRWADDFDLVYFIKRYYSPQLGRFISRDPLGEHGGANQYTAASNDFINEDDALGQINARWLSLLEWMYVGDAGSQVLNGMSYDDEVFTMEAFFVYVKRDPFDLYMDTINMNNYFMSKVQAMISIRDTYEEVRDRTKEERREAEELARKRCAEWRRKFKHSKEMFAASKEGFARAKVSYMSHAEALEGKILKGADAATAITGISASFTDLLAKGGGVKYAYAAQLVEKLDNSANLADYALKLSRGDFDAIFESVAQRVVEELIKVTVKRVAARAASEEAGVVLGSGAGVIVSAVFVGMTAQEISEAKDAYLAPYIQSMTSYENSMLHQARSAATFDGLYNSESSDCVRLLGPIQ